MKGLRACELLLQQDIPKYDMIARKANLRSAEKPCQEFLHNILRKQKVPGIHQTRYPTGSFPRCRAEPQRTFLCYGDIQKLYNYLFSATASPRIAALPSFVPCPVALRRNKALHLTARPSSLRLAVRSAGERRDYEPSTQPHDA
jgi:hypothetical protein